MRVNWRTDESTPAAEGEIENLRSAEKKFPAAATSPVRDLALERHYSVYELSHLWGLSERTIRRLFSDEPGVVKLGHEESRFKRGYMTLRIPESVVQRVHRRIRQVG
jgi:hypothetical protein